MANFKTGGWGWVGWNLVSVRIRKLKPREEGCMQLPQLHGGRDRPQAQVFSSQFPSTPPGLSRGSVLSSHFLLPPRGSSAQNSSQSLSLASESWDGWTVGRLLVGRANLSLGLPVALLQSEPDHLQGNAYEELKKCQ